MSPFTVVDLCAVPVLHHQVVPLRVARWRCGHSGDSDLTRWPNIRFRQFKLEAKRGLKLSIYHHKNKTKKFQAALVQMQRLNFHQMY